MNIDVKQNQTLLMLERIFIYFHDDVSLPLFHLSDSYFANLLPLFPLFLKLIVACLRFSRFFHDLSDVSSQLFEIDR